MRERKGGGGSGPFHKPSLPCSKESHVFVILEDKVDKSMYIK